MPTLRYHNGLSFALSAHRGRIPLDRGYGSHSLGLGSGRRQFRYLKVDYFISLLQSTVVTGLVILFSTVVVILFVVVLMIGATLDMGLVGIVGATTAVGVL